MDKLEVREVEDSSRVPVYQEITLSRAALPASGLLLIAALLCYAFASPINWFGDLGWWAACLGFVFGVVLYLLVFVSSAYGPLNTRAIRDLSRMLNGLFKNLSWGGIILLSALAGVGEELLFRVFIQGSLTDWLGPIAGVTIASILFGLAHYLSRLYVVLTFLIGVIFGTLYYVSQSAVLIMVMHFVYDILAFTALVKFPHLLNLPPEK